MIPAPRRTGGKEAGPIAPIAQDSWPDIDDDDGWQDMPVVRTEKDELAMSSSSDEEEDDREKRYGTAPSGGHASSHSIGHGHGHGSKRSYLAPQRADPLNPSLSAASSSGANTGGAGGSSNATGAHLELDSDTYTLATDSWRQKNELDESDYTRIRLDEDEEGDAVHLRTRYLFDEDKAMTPLSQMQATKELLTEGQRIAYVGLCHLVGRRMVRDTGRGWEGVKKTKVVSLKGKEKALPPVQDSAGIWMIKIMARLYQHMELEPAEQKMIESLAEHGVDPSDLVPALMTTHTVKNPEFDPVAKKQADLGIVDEKDEDDLGPEGAEGRSDEPPPPPYTPRGAISTEQDASAASNIATATEIPLPPSLSTTPLPPASEQSPDKVRSIGETSGIGLSKDGANSGDDIVAPTPKRINPFGDDEDDDDGPFSFPTSRSIVASKPAPSTSVASVAMEEDDGDIGRSLQSPDGPKHAKEESDPDRTPKLKATAQNTIKIGSVETLPSPDPAALVEGADVASVANAEKVEGEAEDENEDEYESEKPEMLPSLPGVSTTLTNLDEHVTLDIRWTVLCDLFLVLIADSVYDARSRTFLQTVAVELGFDWLDSVRFENRITEALELEEAVERTAQGEVIEGRRKQARNKRYAMMGLAAVGGGLVIGLSAGLLAPVIGAGLGAAFATVGIGGTTGFLAGAGGAAVITTTGVVTGANIAGKGMARRTREVRTFELRPLHNNKRVSCYITVGGFMASKVDDVRLPFSVLDSVIGDVASVYWEPEMMEETGGALKILTSEVLTSVGQQVLAATVMAALISALQWPIILTKLGYLIDNPWSNALDRSKAAGLVLADVILNRHAGIRPVSLIGFSLGARAIFYALVELARHKAFGLVQDVFLFGATVTASRHTWLDARSVVSGRFVNGYASNDWMLGYLFRATSGGINTVAGLRPVEMIPGMENVEVTEIITGHMSYRTMMPQLLNKVGLPVTSDHFDEPEDPNIDMTQQERKVVLEGEEEEQQNKKKILGLFPRSSKSKSGSGTTTPGVRGSTEKKDTPTKTAAGEYEYDEDDDDGLPPRMDHPPAKADPTSPKREVEDESGDLGSGLRPTESQEELAAAQVKALKAEEDAVKNIPKTAGFDFAAISKALGKDIDVDKIKVDPAPPSPLPSAVDRPGIERSMSVPPALTVQPPPEELPRLDMPGVNGGVIGRSSSYDFSSITEREDEEDQGDITGGNGVRALSIDDMPSWDRPKASPAALSPVSPIGVGGSGNDGFGYSATPGDASGGWRSTSPVQTPSSASPYGYNAWAAPTASSHGMPMRAAPPARPHPPEFMANPFADKKDTSSAGSGGGGSGLWGWGKKQKSLEDEAMKNPW